MSLDNSLSNIFKNIITDSKISTIYFKHLNVICGFGGTIGLCFSIARLMDISKSNNRKKLRIMNLRKVTNDFHLTEEELSKCENTNFNSLSTIISGPVIGISCGFLWPVIPIIGSIYYIFNSIYEGDKKKSDEDIYL
jgi:hypothetical protein